MSSQCLYDTPGTLHHAIREDLGLERVKELVSNDPRLLNQKDPNNVRILSYLLSS